MVTKQTLSFQKPNMKRCKLEADKPLLEEDVLDGGSSGLVLKRMKTEETFSNSEVDDSVSSEASCCVSKKSIGCRRPPLLKSSRGRTQKLPSKLSDSVISWKDDQPSKIKDSNIRRDLYKEELYTQTQASKDVYRPEEFTVGDIVWAKCGKNSPAWPAKVIDPILEAPPSVWPYYVTGTACVMFYGYATNGTREYAWVKRGMIFPFANFIKKFVNANVPKKAAFQMSFEEANAAQQVTGQEAHLRCSIEGDEVNSKSQNLSEIDGRSCDTHGVVVHLGSRKKTKSSKHKEHLGRQCTKLREPKPQCGICKKTRHDSDEGKWVCCHGCNIWVHAECDKVSGDLFENLEKGDYYCSKCKVESTTEPSELEKRPPKIKFTHKTREASKPDRLAVVCYGMEGTFFPSLTMVECHCGSCGPIKQKMGAWEAHSGSRAKKWRWSVKVKGSLQCIGDWLKAQNTPKFDKEQLLNILGEKYEPTVARWTTEKCAVCRWVEDWEHNQIIICNRCQIAVHQECYGAMDIKDCASWVCRACEKPDIKRECCLCPVKGGALKPTDVEGLWVHVTCAWFHPGVGFTDDDMEPAVGILQIPRESFLKTCVICKQSHGSCVDCRKCSTHMHPMCAWREGYSMQIHCSTRMTKNIIHCAKHREPNPENAIAMHTDKGIFAARSSLKIQTGCIGGSRLVSSKAMETHESPNSDTENIDPLTAARGRIYKRSNSKKAVAKLICHQVKGLGPHSLEDIRIRTSYKEVESPLIFSSYKDRLQHLKETEKHRVCFGKSGIHGFGLFAKRDLEEGETVIEYRGELIRRIVSDVREAKYRKEGKDCYLFKINDEITIDATMKGNLARLTNHSCSPNCYSRIMNIGYTQRIVIIARTKVYAGDELTLDYMFGIDEEETKSDQNKKLCRCKSKNCRGYI